MDGGQSVLEQAPTMQQPAFALSLALAASCVFAQGNLLFQFQVVLPFEDGRTKVQVKDFSSGKLSVSTTGAWEEQSLI